MNSLTEGVGKDLFVRVKSSQDLIMSIAECDVHPLCRKDADRSVIHQTAVSGFGGGQILVQFTKRRLGFYHLIKVFPDLLTHLLHHPGETSDLVIPIQNRDRGNKRAKGIAHGRRQVNKRDRNRLGDQIERRNDEEKREQSTA